MAAFVICRTSIKVNVALLLMFTAENSSSLMGTAPAALSAATRITSVLKTWEPPADGPALRLSGQA